MSVPAPDDDDDEQTELNIYKCWTTHLNKTIDSEHRVKFPNGTDEPELTFKEAGPRCLILGLRILSSSQTSLSRIHQIGVI